MKKINKSSVIGFILGAISTPLIISLGFFFFMWHKLRISEKMGYPPPQLPSLERKIDLNCEIKKLNEDVINIESSFKDKIIFLNFWATWCPPCVGEMPSIQDLYNLIGNDIEIICISNEPMRRINNFKKKKGYTFPIYKIEGNVPFGLSSSGIPTTYIISKERKIILHNIGGANWAHENVIEYLDDLIKQ